MRMIWVTWVRVWLVYNLAVVFHWHIMKENMMINRYDVEGQKEERRWFHSCGLSFQRRQCLRGIQRKWLWLTLIFDLRCNYQGWLISTIWRCSSKMSLLIISDLYLILPRLQEILSWLLLILRSNNLIYLLYKIIPFPDNIILDEITNMYLYEW